MTKILIVLAIVAVVAALLLARRSGPRIRTIETRRDARDGGIERRRDEDEQ